MKWLKQVPIRIVNLVFIAMFSVIIWFGVDIAIQTFVGEKQALFFMALIGLPAGYGMRILEEEYPIITERYLNYFQILKCVLVAPAETYLSFAAKIRS